MKRSNTKQKVSIVVPVYNELGNIEKLHKALMDVCKSEGYIAEIIYIDDHSTDGTYEYLKNIQKNQSVRIHQKQGKKGKAYSLLEGFTYAKGDILVMIDADLQYPPSAIPGMIAKLKESDVVVANRKQYKASLLRRMMSRGFQKLFGHLLFGLKTDVQSGLKVFKKEVFLTTYFAPHSPWTFDLEFLFRAREAGYMISNFDIAFAPRKNGSSKLHFINQIFEIGSNALMVKGLKLPPLLIPAKNNNSMIGAGIGYKKKKYITHTTLPYTRTALHTFVRHQKIALTLLMLGFIASLILQPLFTVRSFVSVISVIYFIDVLFNLYIIFQSLMKDQEIQVSKDETKLLTAQSLPMYTILCPLYKEVLILPQFIKAIEKLDWPKEKLDVMLLLEEDDTETLKAIPKMNLPSYVRVVVVPDSQPKTKPKACNYGLNLAKGEYIVIFDAEDVPDPLQLKKAYLGFQKTDENVICLQAKLNYYNPHQNLLTRFFTAEYSLWFDLTLPGLQSIKTSIPLGGTSNHFKTNLLRKLQGWDTFNVTEDADLGIRLFKEGYKTAIINSVTLEEANSDTKNWIRQRSRWIKGYLQSYLVHMRDFLPFAKNFGIHALLFQLVVGSKLTFIFLNPFLWIITILYFALFSLVGPTIELVYMTPAFYLAVVSLVFGNFLFLYYYMVGCAKRQQWPLMKYIFAVPLYWIMISVAGWVAFYQLLFKPHYWEKTLHGLHLAKSPVRSSRKKKSDNEDESGAFLPKPVFAPDLGIAYKSKKTSFAGFLRIREFITSAKDLKKNILVAITLGNTIIKNNIEAFKLLFTNKRQAQKNKKQQSILIFNWRDTHHVWAGGAEVYIHEIAKRWVEDGNSVTIFSGNDGNLPQTQTVQGVQIIRKGGTYTVYLWAFIYYVLKLRGKFDVIVDCENGIPFFTPLYVRKPIVLLIHHVHQEVFREHLRFPLSAIAAFMESFFMPLLYRNRPIVTVSESSKKEILKLGFTKPENIEIIYNGSSQAPYLQASKTPMPSFIYLGRLKAYKNIDVCIKAFAHFFHKNRSGTLHIVGQGESLEDLQQLVQNLGIEKQVMFHGRVSEKRKSQLLAQSWAMIQPSQVEGWGITVIEANTNGTPVIASHVNGLKDSVIHEETGLLVSPNDVYAFAKAMERLATDTMYLQHLSSKALVWSRNFTWEKSAQVFYALLESTLKRTNFAGSYGKLILAKPEQL